MPTQEEIKAAMATYFAFREPTRSGMATIRLPSRPSAKETTAAAFVLAEAYIEEHDDTPITLDWAVWACSGKNVHISQIGSDICLIYDLLPDRPDVRFPIKTRSQLLALLKGLGE